MARVHKSEPSRAGIFEVLAVKSLWLLLLITVDSRSAVLYDMVVRPVVEGNLSLAGGAPPSVPAPVQYFIEDGKVRVGGANAKTIYLFRDRTLYVIDVQSRTVHVLQHATLSDVAAHFTDTVKQLERAAAAAPTAERAAAERKAADSKAVSDRLLATVPHDFSLTARYEAVDGHACRIWEERENGVKRLELCVAPTATLPGGGDIVNGMKTLSQFRQGANFALGVDFGLASWWSDVATLNGVPLLLREYKYDSLVSEVVLTGIRAGAVEAHAFDLPNGFTQQDGPEYVQWYLH